MCAAYVCLRNDGKKFRFNSKRRVSRGQSGSVGDAKNMRIDRNGRLAKGLVEHDIRGLAADARQRFKTLAILRDSSVEPFEQSARQRHEVLCLVAI